jgi:hypothetical protein
VTACGPQCLVLYRRQCVRARARTRHLCL